MKFIIHDWNDEQSIEILTNLAKSAKPGATVLLVESVVEEDDAVPSMSKVMDLNMLAMTGGPGGQGPTPEQLEEMAAKLKSMPGGMPKLPGLGGGGLPPGFNPFKK